MTLTFPNPARSFDDDRNGVRFTGYDGMFEVAFLVQAEALECEDGAERESLAAFDAARTKIHDVAREAYANGRQNRYVLTPDDFR